jgi:hypothetical protein
MTCRPYLSICAGEGATVDTVIYAGLNANAWGSTRMRNASVTHAALFSGSPWQNEKETQFTLANPCAKSLQGELYIVSLKTPGP